MLPRGCRGNRQEQEAATELVPVFFFFLNFWVPGTDNIGLSLPERGCSIWLHVEVLILENWRPNLPFLILVPASSFSSPPFPSLFPISITLYIILFPTCLAPSVKVEFPAPPCIATRSATAAPQQQVETQIPKRNQTKTREGRASVMVCHSPQSILCDRPSSRRGIHSGSSPRKPHLHNPSSPS